MKVAIFPSPIHTGVGLVLLVSSITASAADTSPSAGGQVPQTQSGDTGSSASPRLPYGVEGILKLTRAQVSEEVVLSYIQNSGTTYNLAPSDIVYLRNEGVPDRVLNAMLDQKKHVAESAPAQAPVAQSAPAETAVAPAPAQYAAAPAPVYVQPPAPEPAPSTVYVIPYPAASYAYYGGYTPYYYGGYYGPYCGPTISFGFRFGGFGYHHGFYGHHWHH